MKVFAIGDLHLSGNPPTKPMDIFGPHWDNHWARIKEHWANNVTDDDIVFLVGDMSWALRLDEAACDLQEIASMPGKKYMIRGNHDYWWASSNKMRNLMGDAITFYKVMAQQSLFKQKKALASSLLVELVPTSALVTPISHQKQTNLFMKEN